MELPNSLDGTIRREQATDVLRGLASTLVSNLFVACSLAGMMWEVVPRAQIFAFLATNTAVNAARGLVARRWLRLDAAARDPKRILAACWIAALLSGLCWAVALLGCAYHGQAFTMAVALAFSGLNAGAIIQNRVARASAIAFVLPNTSILVTLFLLEGSLPSQIVAVNLTLLTGLMLRWSSEQETHYLRSNCLKYEAMNLAESLKAANIAAGQALQRLEHASRHDHLTGLLNRTAYRNAFAARLEKPGSETEPFWILLIDLDRFKAINDTFGHTAGDEVLTAVGRRLTECLGPQAVIARLGGDEFAALIAGDVDDAAGPRLAQAVVDHLSEVVIACGRSFPAGASVGVAHWPSDGSTLADLQIRADLALYAAKSDGRGTWRRFAEAMHRTATIKRELERDLAEGLESGAIQAWFQPQVDGGTGRVTGCEALLRWHHPRFGWISPPDVIAAAAATHRASALTQAVLRDACRMAQLLDAIGRRDVVVSINVSPDEFGTYPIAELVASELAAHALAASRLAIEITEEAIYSIDRGGPDVEALTRMGVAVIVDDFGIGYSSINSLRCLPFDGLKIDRSFVRGIADDPQDRLLLEAILAFARTLGVSVVAEGVETEEQFAVLRQLGCPALQGYLFAPAMPQTAALTWITRNDLGLRIAQTPQVQGSVETDWARSARG